MEKKKLQERNSLCAGDIQGTTTAEGHFPPPDHVLLQRGSSTTVDYAKQAAEADVLWGRALSGAQSQE